MYGSALYSRQRSAYDDYDRLGYSWHSTAPNYAPSRSTSGTTVNSMSNNQPRRTRYARSSTTSVTQLLSDSCTSLLQKLSTKVRGPSATIESHIPNRKTPISNPPIPLSTSISTTSLGTARSRFEDKYSSVLDRIYGRRKDNERTLEPSVGRTLTKSATTSHVYVPNYTSANNVREKTPYKTEKKPQYPEPPYSYLDRDSIYRVRHKSNHSDLRPRRSSKPQRKSEMTDRKTSLKLIDIPLDEPNKYNEDYKKFNEDSRRYTEATKFAENFDQEATPTNFPEINERETKRKEIQSLIMKYSALDEAYNRAGAAAAPPIAPPIPVQPSVHKPNYHQHHSHHHSHHHNKALATTAVSTGRVC